MTTTTTTIIIGAGPAGLAMSCHLTDRSIDHVVLERGRVVERWHSERWDSLRLLTPNWQTRLPGWHYRGPNPDGFMTMPEVVGFLGSFAASCSAPVQTETTVISVNADPTTGDGYRVVTDQGTWSCRSVIVATGATGRPRIPGFATDAPHSIQQIAPNSYRNPDQLAENGVLIVGASASGLQLADELQRSGRPVTLAVGSHARVPRTYRGMDIQWWLNATGALDLGFDQVRDIDAARRAPSLQLIGAADHQSLDLGILAERGVRLTGHLAGIDDGTARFTDDLTASCVAADASQERILDRIDRWIETHGLTSEFLSAERPRPLIPRSGPESLALASTEFGTILWATGYRQHNPWLHVPVTDQAGNIRHRGGVTDAPGLYVLGLPFLRRRKSTFLDGFGADAADLADHLTHHLDRVATAA
jgi:putative flavoprotein involved in K+ transport